MRKLSILVLSAALLLMFSTNVIAQQGKQVKVASNQELIEALENPEVKSIKVVTGGYYDHYMTYLDQGTILFKGPENRGDTCTYKIRPTHKCFIGDSITPGGDTLTKNRIIAGTEGSQPPCPDDNSGTWSCISKPAGATVHWIDPLDEYVMNYAVDVAGSYTFKYEWTPQTSVQAEVFIWSLPDISLTADDSTCLPNCANIDFDVSWGYAPPNDSVYWKLFTPGTDPDSTFTQPDTTGTFCLDVATCGSYTLRVWVENWDYENNYVCEDSADVDFDFFDEPVIDAGPDDSICGLTYELDPGFTTECGNPTTQWLHTTGASFSEDTVTVTACGTYQFIYKVTNGPCVNTDTVEITFIDTPTVDAGVDDSVCGLKYVLDPTVTYSCGTPDTGWLSASGASFNGDTVTVASCGSYDFIYFAFNDPCDTVYDTVNITFVDTPTADAGIDDSICGLTYELKPDVTYQCIPPITGWMQTAGASFNGDTVTVSPCGVYDFVLYAWSEPCDTVFETVQISFFDEPVVDAGVDDSVCGLTYALNPTITNSCGTPVTGWLPQSGVDVLYDTAYVSDCGSYDFILYAWNDPCDTVFDTVNVYFYDEPYNVQANSEDSVDVCGLSYTLSPYWNVDCDNGVTPTTSFTKIWGPGDDTLWVDNTVYVDTCGWYGFEFKVVNGLCEKTDTAVVNFHEIPDPEIVILGDSLIYRCGVDTFVVLDNRICDPFDDDLLISWTASGGTIVGSTTNDTIIVEWDELATGCVSVDVEIDGDPDCEGSDEKCYDKLWPTLEGQVKYWNEFETYMPTPYATDINGTTPPDYFYVELYELGIDDTTQIGDYELVDYKIVPGDELTSWWSFGELRVDTLDCDAELLMKVWDGGLLYDPGFPSNGFNRYLGAAYTYNHLGGVNATDAYAINKMAAGIDINGGSYNYTWVGTPGLSPAYGYYSFGIADVNVSGGINATDALMTLYRATGKIPFYYNAKPGYMYSPNYEVTGRMVDSLPQKTWSAYFDTAANVNDVPFSHSGEDYLYYDSAVHHKYTSVAIPWQGDKNYMNIYYECLGDISASYVPPKEGFKAEPSMELNYEGLMYAAAGDEVIIPVSIDRDVTVGAVTVTLKYNNELIEVTGVNYEDDYFHIDHKEGHVGIGWYTNEPFRIEKNSAIVNIKVRVLDDIDVDTRLFALDANTEFADPAAHPIDGINLKTVTLTSDRSAFTSNELFAKNYPNPFSNKTTIAYMLPEAGKVKIEVYNKMGQIVTTVVEETQTAGMQNVEFNYSNLEPGVYHYRVTLKGENRNYAVTKSMIVMQ